MGTRTAAAATVWPFSGSISSGQAPRERRALTGSSQVRERPLPGQKSKWKQLWSPVLSAASQSFGSYTSPTTVSAYRESYETREKKLHAFFCKKTSPSLFLQASFPLNQLYYWLFLFPRENRKWRFIGAYGLNGCPSPCVACSSLFSGVEDLSCLSK